MAILLIFNLKGTVTGGEGQKEGLGGFCSPSYIIKKGLVVTTSLFPAVDHVYHQMLTSLIDLVYLFRSQTI